MAENGNGRRELLQKVLLWLGTVLVAINISVIGYIATGFHELEIRIARIEANRFTNGDGNGLLQKMLDIERRMAELPKEVPPAWFREFVYDNRARIKELEKRK
jgi:hypothetical protein